jgi:hypothetical protein
VLCVDTYYLPRPVALKEGGCGDEDTSCASTPSTMKACGSDLSLAAALGSYCSSRGVQLHCTAAGLQHSGQSRLYRARGRRVWLKKLRVVCSHLPYLSPGKDEETSFT